jgi:tetratricopeptide (TPR) repeat protein
MTCKQAQEALNDRLAPSTGAMSAELTAHLDSCPVCRAHAASMEGIARCLADMRAFAAAIPAEVLEENKRRILAAIADAAATKPARRFARHTPPATTRQQPAKDFSSPRIHPVLLWSAAGIAATLVMIFGIFFRDRTPATGTPEPPAPAVPVVAATAPKSINQGPKVTNTVAPIAPRAAVQEPPITFAWLKEEFARLKVAREGVTWDYLKKVVKYLTTGQRTRDENVEGWQLLADAYEAAGEGDRAKNAFTKYLDFMEAKGPRELAMNAAQTKAANLFYAKKEYLNALAYYDMIATRYPGTPEAANAKLMSGEYFNRQQMWTEGASQFALIAKELPKEDPAGRRARQCLSSSLANSQRFDEAVSALKEMQEDNTDEDAAGYACFWAGHTHMRAGVSHYPLAVKEFQSLIEKYPKHRYVGAARQFLNKIQQEMVTGEGQVVPRQG